MAVAAQLPAAFPAQLSLRTLKLVKAHYPTIAEKIIAIVFRTALVFLLAWILVRATWPTELLFETRLGDLTFGGLLFGIFWLLLSLWIAAVLLLYALPPPARSLQIDLWCSFWIWAGIVVIGTYGGALFLLAHPLRHSFLADIAFSVSVFLWWLVV
jgi:hypothetical protein